MYIIKVVLCGFFSSSTCLMFGDYNFFRSNHQSLTLSFSISIILDKDGWNLLSIPYYLKATE